VQVSDYGKLDWNDRGVGAGGGGVPQKQGRALATPPVYVYFSIQILLIAAMVCFQRVATHPIVILLLTMELSICAFFFFLYSLAINRYIPFVFWPMMVSKKR
jgi:hypothetical protein